MGNLNLSRQKTSEKDFDDDGGLTDLERQWMDPHKRKILETIDDVNAKCHEKSFYDAIDVSRAIRKLCLVIYSANDFELIQKCQETFGSLLRLLRDPKTPFLLRLEIISAVSVLCQGNQVNCRAWCAEGGIKTIVDQIRDVPADKVLDPLHRQALQTNIWVIYTLRTLMCGSGEAIKSVVHNSSFPQFADLLARMSDSKEIWDQTAEKHNYAADCCIFLGIGGKKAP